VGGEQGRIDGWVNDAILDILRKTRCYVRADTMTMTANEKDYDLSSLVLVIMEMELTGNYAAFDRVSGDELRRLRRSSVATDTTTYKYALEGANLVMVYPTPSSAVSIDIYYVPRPTALSAPADDPSAPTFGGVPAEFHEGIELYAMWKAADFDDDQTSAQGQRYKEAYDKYVKDMRSELRGKVRGPAPRAVVNARRARLPRRNDQDF
jgi:hypothetical protein